MNINIRALAVDSTLNLLLVEKNCSQHGALATFVHADHCRASYSSRYIFHLLCNVPREKLHEVWFIPMIIESITNLSLQMNVNHKSQKAERLANFIHIINNYYYNLGQQQAVPCIFIDHFCYVMFCSWFTNRLNFFVHYTNTVIN